jgi:tetratricopeptide (TPR) repeat protein
LAYRIREEFKNCSIFWIPVSDMESLHQAYKHIAQRLNILGWDDEKADVKQLVQLYLSKESAGQWLLVFDITDRARLETAGSSQAVSLIEYLPVSDQGAIVFTTTDKKTAITLALQDIVELPEMEQDIAQRMLEMYLISPTNEPEVADLLLKELAYLPLAIAQAAAYININKITLRQYLLLLAEQKEEVVEPIGKECENVIASTWLISFEQIRRQDTVAADYLLFMACVDPTDVPLALLPMTSPREKGIDAVGTLNAYSFVTKRTAESALDLHRLVHLLTRNWLKKQESLSQRTQVAITRLLEVFPDSNHWNRSKWRRLLPHVKFALSSGLPGQKNEARMNLAYKHATALFSDGRFNEAEAYFNDNLQSSKEVLGPEDPDTLAIMANLASTFGNQGHWEEAKDLEMQVMEISLRVLGAEHPSTLTSIANLASIYRNQGHWKEAEDLEVQVMETSLKVLGPEHPDTLISIGNLASTFWNQGHWKKAADLQVQVIETSLRVLGPEHPSTLTSMANLASTFLDQGRWKEAEDLEVQVIETSLRVLGLEHPSTLTSMANLASTYRNQERWKEAEELQATELEICSRVLGQEHPDTLTSMANLAYIWKGHGRDVDALELMKQCVEAQVRILGSNHPDTLSSSTTLLEWEAEKLEVSTSADRE